MALLAFAASMLVLYAIPQPPDVPRRVPQVLQPSLPDALPGSPAVGDRTGRPGFDAGALRGRLEVISARYAGDYGVVVYEPDSGASVALDADETFYAASIGKLPTLLALYRAAAGGELDLDSRIQMLPQDVRAEGSGVLHTFPLYSEMTLRQCAYYLVNESDNTAWKMLDRSLGMAKIQAELESVGASSTDYAAHTTTPNDVLLVLEGISSPAYTSEALSEEMLAAMTGTAYEDRIPVPLPPDVRVAHKIGSYGDSFGDAGIVFFEDRAGRERRYYLVIMSEGTTEAEARAAIQEMSLAAYEAFVTPNP